MKRSSFLAVATLLVASTLSAGTLHSNDPKYRGAFTIMTAGLVQGARAAYWTEMKILNDSDHAIAKLRFELYPTTGEDKEWIDDVNPLQAFPDALGAYGYGWGMIMAAGDPSGETPVLVPGGWLAQELGANDMGTLRVVALNADGSDDMTAVLGGSARIWTMPNSGGRMWMDQPGLSDYELISNDLRISRNYLSNPEAVVRLRTFMPVRMFIYGEETTELVGLVNFDRTKSVTFTLGGRDETGPGSRKCVLPQIQVEVPAGQSRRVAIDHCPGPFAGGGTTVSVPPGTTGAWTAYEQFVDPKTGSAQINYDWITQILLLRRAH